MWLKCYDLRAGQTKNENHNNFHTTQVSIINLLKLAGARDLPKAGRVASGRRFDSDRRAVVSRMIRWI